MKLINFILIILFFMITSCVNFNIKFNKLKEKEKLKVFSIVSQNGKKILKLKSNFENPLSPYNILVLNANNKIINLKDIKYVNTSNQPILYNDLYYIENGCQNLDNKKKNCFIIYNIKENNFSLLKYNNRLNNVCLIDNFLFYNNGKSGNGLYRINLLTETEDLIDISSFGNFYNFEDNYYYQFISPDLKNHQTYLIKNGEIISIKNKINDKYLVKSNYQFNEDELDKFNEILRLDTY